MLSLFSTVGFWLNLFYSVLCFFGTVGFWLSLGFPLMSKSSLPGQKFAAWPVQLMQGQGGSEGSNGSIADNYWCGSDGTSPQGDSTKAKPKMKKVSARKITDIYKKDLHDES
jgi:hypothetical protein